MSILLDRIMDAAAKKGMKKMVEVERYCEIPVRTLSNIKAYDVIPRGKTLAKICAHLDIDEEQLMDGLERKKSPGRPRIAQDQTKKVEIVVKNDRLREFVNTLASLDDKDFDTMIDYMYYIKSRKGKD